MNGKKYCCCGSKERYWMGMANYLQDHILSASQPTIALWVFKNSHGEAHAWFKAHEILLRNYFAIGGNMHLLTMAEFSYNVKKRKVI
jgi:hypothetical protein